MGMLSHHLQDTKFKESVKAFERQKINTKGEKRLGPTTKKLLWEKWEYKETTMEKS